ncbi:hypothetical protein AKJ55_01765 [candidate division MSBL1 archaeon SCGC-AAA382M17]|uniref:Uncharacterized protein n=1 Tax=candidate division MSBL1 archaeon SCGC-AAA382M17 TaxID=1698284 RepID=A0ABR5TJ49_9EURY|nr:hypothetical protein AKJ55_01765 [candidate division MSBL1 archaeon SCGC-AAA382M17]
MADDYPLMEPWQEPTPEEQPVVGAFRPADRESLTEKGEGLLTAFVVPLVALVSTVTFALLWRKRE